MSYIFHVNFEQFLPKLKINKFFASGERSFDMLLRLQYANCNVSNQSHFETNQLLISEIGKQTQPTIVLCTYTAMMNFRRELETKVSLKKINEMGN